MSSIVSSAITAGAGALTSAATNATNAAIAHSTNQSNMQMNEANNASNQSIAQQTNETNIQLQREQNEWNRKQWEDNNQYNTPQAQMQRLVAAGINPLSANSGLTPGASASPAASTAPAQAVGAVMNPSHIDPFSLDSSITEAILNGANLMNDTRRVENETTTNFWNVRKTQEETESIRAHKEIDLNQAPYNVAQSLSVISDNNASAKLKAANEDYVRANTDLARSQIDKNYNEIAMSYLQYELQERQTEVAEGNLEVNRGNLAVNQQNAETARGSLELQQEQLTFQKESFQSQLKQKSFDQVLAFCSHYITNLSGGYTLSTTSSSGSGMKSGMDASLGDGSGSGSGSGNFKTKESPVEGLAKSLLPSWKFGGFFEGHDEWSSSAGQTTNSGGSKSLLNIPEAVKDFAAISALTDQLYQYVSNPGLSPAQRAQANSMLLKMNGELQKSRMRVNKKFKIGLVNMSPQGISVPWNSDSFQ